MAGEKIIVECYGDSLLIKQLKHEYLADHSSIGQVANRMIGYFENRFALAVIDSDKALGPGYFKKENLKVAGNAINGVQLYKCKGKYHYVIKIVPAFEGFILAAAEEADFDRGKFKLPADEKEFRKICKRSDLHANQRMVNFVNAIVTTNPPSIKALRLAIAEAFKNKPR
jgi:hypothetical protein